jgi:hypothetical protein
VTGGGIGIGFGEGVRTRRLGWNEGGDSTGALRIGNIRVSANLRDAPKLAKILLLDNREHQIANKARRAKPPIVPNVMATTITRDGLVVAIGLEDDGVATEGEAGGTVILSDRNWNKLRFCQ